MDKQQTNGSGETLVSFRLPGEVAATTASVVGEFNDWSADAHRMRRNDEGFAVVIPLAPGRAYRFRYLLDGERWMNDWAADAYVPNEFGGEDSVVDLTDRPVVDAPTDGATDDARRSARPSRTDGGRVPACR
jgi:1,4-alpha-glucan branching enzyme